MKTKLLFLMAICAVGLNYAQNLTLSGKITYQNKALPGVTVYAEGQPNATTSAKDGTYSLNLKKGNYTIIFSYGNTYQTEINLTESTEFDLKWEKTIESLNEVLVNSVRVKADSPITHTNLSKTEIEERNLGQDIPILMKFMPSVVSTSDAGNGVGYTGIRVRGSDASRVNVTINGIPYNDQESQGTFWVNLPDFASSTQNLQLQRGVGTSTNGSGAFGASLNLLTEAASTEANASISNSYGSFNTRKHNVTYSTGLLQDKFEISGRLSQINSDGYVDRAFSDLKSYFLQGVFTEGDTYIKALTFGGHNITYQSWFGIDAQTLQNDRTFNPAGEYVDAQGNTRYYDNEVDDYKQDHYQLHWHQNLNSNWSSKLSLNYTYGRGFFEQYVDEANLAFHNISNAGRTESDLIRRRWLDNDYFVSSLDLNYQDKNLVLNSGVFYSFYTNDHFGEVIWSRFAGDSEIRDPYYNGDGTKNEFTIFSKATYKFNEQWQAFLDLQGRFVSYETSGFTSDKVAMNVDQKYEFFNPKLGLSYQLDKANQFYFSYGKAHREPRRTDFENNITKAEELDDFELGWRYVTDQVEVNTNAYYMYYNNQMVLTGALDDVGAPIRETSGKSYRLGLELDAQIKLSKNFSLMPNVAVSQNKNIDFIAELDGQLQNLGNTNISFSPELIAANQFVFHPTKNFQMGLLSKFVGEQYMGNIDSEVSKLDSFFTTDFNLVYRWDNAPMFKSIVFTGLVNNVFDEQYVSNGYFYTYDVMNNGNTETIGGAGYYPQAGINFLLGVELKF